MKGLVFLLVLVVCCSARINQKTAVKQDLTGKIFTFPVDKTLYGHKDHVTVKAENWKKTTATTVCIRFFTDKQTKYFNLFSLTTHSAIYWIDINAKRDDKFQILVRNWGRFYQGLTWEFNRWNSICATWESNTGLSQFWLNGRPSARKVTHSEVFIREDDYPSIVLGQQQEEYGGRFNHNYAFHGSLTDLHMWDYVLSPQEIQNYMEGVIDKPGNYLNWKSLEYITHGEILVEDYFGDVVN